jgi:hypothetical protein
VQYAIGRAERDDADKAACKSRRVGIVLAVIGTVGWGAAWFRIDSKEQ